jgi:hypothetical protein
MREINKAPDSVVEAGRFCYGCYNEPIRRVNLLDARLGSLGLFKNSRLREWQAFQLYSDQGWFVMIALYNTKKICIVQFILYNRHTKKKIYCEKKVLPRSLRIPNGLYKTQASHSSKGFDFAVDHDIDDALLTIKVQVAATKDHPQISAQFSAEHDCSRFVPIVVCMPFTEKKGMYSHKCLMPLEGQVSLGQDVITFDKKDSSLIIDDHKGYYPYNTRYDWATALGFDDEGRRFGFNLTDNQVSDQDKYNENCFWINGEMLPLPPVKFTRPNGYREDWIIEDKTGAVKLVFTPQAHNSVRLNLLLLASNYEGPYGVFNGEIQVGDGRYFPLKDTFGMGEKLFLRS